MPKADHSESSKSRQPKAESDSEKKSRKKSRMVTEEEWSGLVEDAKRFKERHKDTFRRLSRGE